MITNCLQAANVSVCRSGVIPYTIINNTLYFLFAIDSKYNELTDFGGGVKKNETIITGGLRELQEESCGIFSKINLNDVHDCVTILNTKMAVIFIPISPLWYGKVEKVFLSKVTPLTENKNVIWIDLDKLQTFYIAKQHKPELRMWKKVQKFFKNNFNEMAEESLRNVFNNRLN